MSLKMCRKMTNAELNKISEEIDHISDQISTLDPDNAIENSFRENLFHQWDFLDYQLDCALISTRHNNLKILT